jgi:hypothetical protein
LTKVFDAGLHGQKTLSKKAWKTVIWNAKAKVYHDKNKRKEAILFFDIWTDLFQEHIKCFFAHSHIVFIFRLHIKVFHQKFCQSTLFT